MDAAQDRVGTDDGGRTTAVAAGGHPSGDARDSVVTAGHGAGTGAGGTAPAGSQDAPGTWLAGRRVAIATAVAIAATMAPAAALGLLEAPLDPDGLIITMLAISGVAAILGTWAAVRWPRPTTWQAVGIRPASRGWLALGAALGVVTMLLNTGTAYLYAMLTGDQSIPLDRMAMVEALAGPLWQSLLLALLGSALVPLGEELIFRGVVFGWLRRWPLPVAVTVSALVFAVLHGFSVVFPVALVLGVATALIYHRSGSLWPAVMLHAVNNAVAFGATLLFQ